MIWKWLIGIAAVPVGLAVLVAGTGVLLPADHVATAAADIAAPPERVAATVRDVEAQPHWRRGVTRIEPLEREGNRLRYVEHSKDGTIPYDFTEEVPGRRFRSLITDPRLPFGGYWIIFVEPKGAGTEVRIEEHGTVRNPVFRFVSKWILGHEATIRAYLADLGAVTEA